MNKRDLVGKIAAEAQITRAQASRALAAFVNGVEASLLKGDRVTISGFGSFMVAEHKARSVRDPRRGTPIRINARRTPRFAAGMEFKAAMNRPAGGA